MGRCEIVHKQAAEIRLAHCKAVRLVVELQTDSGSRGRSRNLVGRDRATDPAADQRLHLN